MKKILYSILMGGVLLFIPTSCENEVKDLSKVTYYADLQLNGDEFVKLNVGDTYNEPGYKATEKGEDITEKVKVNGSVDTNANINIKKVELHGIVLNDIPCMVSNSSDTPLLLGQAVLSKLGKVTIDYDNNLLIIDR